MNRFRLFLPVLLISPSLFGASKEILELQRDVAQINDQIKTLQRSFDEKIIALTELVRQLAESSKSTSTTVAVLDRSIADKTRDLEKVVAAPVTALSSKVDTMASEFQGAKENIADLTERSKRIQQKLNEMEKLCQSIKEPVLPPPSNAGGAPQGGAPPNPDMVYQSAKGDLSGGNVDLALSGFQNYLKFYPNGEYAPNAQYYIGEVYRTKEDWDNAIASFDKVLANYPDSNKAPDANYMKGVVQLKASQRAAAIRSFKEVLNNYPTSDVAKKAQDQLRGLGQAPPAAAPTKKKARK
jgi:tol-pal system protein YbgF